MDDVNGKQVQRPLAHVRQLSDGEWAEHFLDDHLLEVARLAAEFAAPFGSEDWGQVTAS